MAMNDPGKTEKTVGLAWFGPRPPRQLSKLMSLVAMSGLALAALTPRPGAPTPTPPRIVPRAPYVWTPTGSSSTPPPLVVPADRFVLAAPDDLDPRFVLAAPDAMDPHMVFPSTGRFATSRP